MVPNSTNCELATTAVRWHSAFRRRNQEFGQTFDSISFDLLSDFYPHGEVAQMYGVFRPKDGISERAVFVVDRQGRVVWSRTYAIPEQPPIEHHLGALANLGGA